MKTLHATQAGGAQLRGIGRCALVGTLVGMLATQSFALSGPMTPAEGSTQPDASAVPAATQTLATSAAISAAALPGTSESNPSSLSALPPAPDPSEMATVNHPPKFDPMISEAAQDGQALQSSKSTSNDHKVQRPGMLVLGVIGAAAMGMGAYLYSYPTNNTKGKAILGTMFMAPGAAAAGFGFYFAFHKSN